MIRRAIIISISGKSLTVKEKNIIKKGRPWGIILFSRNIESLNQIKKLITSIRFIIKDKKFPIIIDEEGGQVSRLSKIIDNSIYNQKFFGEIYKKNKNKGLKIFKNYNQSICEVLNKIGININSVPVLDILKKNTHKVVRNRIFSNDIDTINNLAKICSNAYKKNKVGTIIKHIPGHGGAKFDSHLRLPIINENIKSLKNKDFKCFKGISSYFAMTGHILFKKIDSKNNVTHSEIIIKKIIRKYIGFKGILISDDISMKALKYDIYKNARLALNSGCNLVLYCGGKIKETQKLLKQTPYIDKFTKKKTSEFYKFLS